jgi:hypothetical protein
MVTRIIRIIRVITVVRVISVIRAITKYRGSNNIIIALRKKMGDNSNKANEVNE